MSRVARFIHERHSMRATPSCLDISLLQMSRNCKGFTIMDYERFIERKILTSIAFSTKISVSSRICCDPNAGFYLTVRRLTLQYANITDQNLALFVVLDNSSRTNLETKIVPDVYAHLLQHLEVLYRIIVKASSNLYSITHHFQRGYEKHA